MLTTDVTADCKLISLYIEIFFTVSFQHAALPVDNMSEDCMAIFRSGIMLHFVSKICKA